MHRGALQKRSETPKLVRTRCLHTILTKGNKLWRMTRHSKRVWLCRGSKLWEGKYMWETNGGKELFRKVSVQT